MDVAAWLRNLQLERYELVFRDNAIDAEVLPELSEADLEKLGVVLGHRKKLLVAIQALRQESQLQDARAPPSQTRIGEPGAAPAAAIERRQLTVMFVDLVGSTALSAGSIPRRCARSSAPIRMRSRARSFASRGTSPNSWATACSPISAGRRRTRTRPSGRYGPDLR